MEKIQHEIYLRLQKMAMIQVAIFTCPVEHKFTFKQLKLPACILGMFLHLKKGISNGLKLTSH